MCISTYVGAFHITLLVGGHSSVVVDGEFCCCCTYCGQNNTISSIINDNNTASPLPAVVVELNSSKLMALSAREEDCSSIAMMKSSLSVKTLPPELSSHL